MNKAICSRKYFEAELDAFYYMLLFYSMRRPVDAASVGAMYRFTHYNHNKCDQLEMLIHYEKDGRKVTGENGLRIMLDGNDVEELGVDERLTFEV